MIKVFPLYNGVIIKRDKMVLLSARDNTMLYFPPTQHLAKYEGYVHPSFDLQHFCKELTDATTKYIRAGKFKDLEIELKDCENIEANNGIKSFKELKESGTDQELFDYVNEFLNLLQCGWEGWVSVLSPTVNNFEFYFDGERVIS